MKSLRIKLVTLVLIVAALTSGCMMPRPGGNSTNARSGPGGTPSALPNRETLEWDDLIAVVDHKIAISLPDAYLKGTARGLTAGALEMEVSETSNPELYPPGRTLLPRSEVSTLLVFTTTRRESAMGEQLGGMAGSGGVLGLGAIGSGSAASMLGRMGAGVAGAMLGALLGRELDDVDVYTVVHVAPEPTSVVTAP